MKKFLSFLAVLGIVSSFGIQTVNAFTWSDMNPFNWRKCNKCEKKIENCPCSTGYAAPCAPCEKKTPCKPHPEEQETAPCDACDRLQQDMAK